MKQAAFESQYGDEWQQLERTLDSLEKRRSKARTAESLHDFPMRYRRLVGQHALAVERHYSIGLIDRLENLMQRGHHQLYRERELLLWQVLHFLVHSFPAAVRAKARFIWLAAVLFYAPALLVGTWCFVNPDAVYSVLEPESVATFEYMYDPANSRIGRTAERQSDSDFAMFGFYIYNNTSIGFRVFAGGMLFGLGTVFITAFNGVVIGATAGHLTSLGYTDTFWGFVSGHSSFELTAIVISSAAGLMLGNALLFPGGRRRLDALNRAAAEAVPLITGAALFFLVAAFIEGFWSSASLDPLTKYVVGIVLWGLVIAYLALSGRNRHAT